MKGTPTLHSLVKGHKKLGEGAERLPLESQSELWGVVCSQY